MTETSSYILADWDALPPVDADDNFPNEIPKVEFGRSRLDVHVGSSAVPFLNASARASSLFQVSYWLNESRMPDPLPILDLFINKQAARVELATLRSTNVFGNRVDYVSFPHQYGRPYLLGSSLFWGYNLSRPSQGGISFANGVPGWYLDAGPNAALAGFPMGDTFEYAAVPAPMGSSPCGLVVEGIIYSTSIRENAVIRLEFAPGIPLPIRYQEQLVDFPSSKLVLVLEKWASGAGKSFQRSDATPPPTVALPLRTIELEAVSGVDAPFATTLRNALSALRSDRAFQEWNQAYPDNRLSQVRHRVGPPDGSGAIDEWELVYGTDGPDAIVAKVSMIPPLIPGIGNSSLEVALRPETQWVSEQFPPSRQASVSLHDLANVSRELYGPTLEVLRCDLSNHTLGFAHCWIGSHTGSNVPYAGTAGSGFVFVSTVVSLDSGIWREEHSLDNPGIPLPVRHW